MHYPLQLIRSVTDCTHWHVDTVTANKLRKQLKPKSHAVFLDSDGVLNTAVIREGKPTAPRNLSELVIPDEVKPALEKLRSAGYLLICVTNKPDIERGLMTQQQVDEIFNLVRHLLNLDDIFICYSENAECYKPKPGLLLTAARKYNIDLHQSYMIGDRWRDIEAGQNAGCKTIWIDRHYEEKKPFPPADFTAFSLTNAVEWILGQHKKPI